MYDRPDPKKKKDPEGMPGAFAIGAIFGPDKAHSDDFKDTADRDSSRYKAAKGNAGDRRAADALER